MPAKRVLHIFPHSGGGAEVYVSTLESSPGFVHERFYLSAGRTPTAAAVSLPWHLPSLLARIRACDIVHVHGDAAAVITACLLGGRPTVITTHGLHLLRRSQGRRLGMVRAALRRAGAVSRSVIATSTSEMSELEPIFRPQDRSKLTVIFNGVSSPPPTSESEIRALRADLCIGPATVLGVFAGELEPRKEPLLAIAAAERVRRRDTPFVLAIAGSGPLSSAVRSQATDAIRALGQVADIRRLFAAADVFLQPSSREGLSLALLEAMSHGLAVIAADSPGNSEAIADAGLVFAAGDEVAMADAVERIVTQPELRTRLGHLAQLRVAEYFGACRFVDATTAVYWAILGSPPMATIE